MTYFYSDNYSKYIEDLKTEKSRNAFKLLVSSSQEDKSNEIEIENVFSEKTDTSASIPENSASEKTDTSASIPENSASEKNGENISYEQNNVSSTRNPKINFTSDYNSEKENVKVGEEFQLGKKSSDDLSFSNEFSNEQIGKEVSVNNSLSDKNESKLTISNELSEKSGNDVGIESEYAVKESDDLSFGNEFLKKDEDGFNIQNSLSKKDGIDLISRIKEEKKSGKKILDGVLSGNKKEGRFAYLLASPKKDEKTNLNRSSALLFTYDTRAFEEKEYAYNAENYTYYPFEAYSTTSSKVSGALQDTINTITNASNWDSVGKGVVNALKITTNIVDMINLSGNQYNSNTANNLRWNLGLSSDKLTGEKKEFAVFGITRKTEGTDENDTSIETKTNLVSDGEKTDDEISQDIQASEKEEDKISGQTIEENSTSDFTVKTTDSKKEEVDVEGWIDDGNGIYNIKDNFPDFKEEYSNIDDNSGYDIKKLNKEEKEKSSAVKIKDEGSKEEFVLLNVKKDDGESLQEKKNSIFGYLPQSADSKSNRTFDYNGNIGNIYVIPPYNSLSQTEDEGNRIDVAFKIPLQNSLQFEQTSRAAAYNAIQFFGRIGDIQQYSRTGSLEAITLTTKYFVDSDDGDYTMAKLQDIEMMYRSLVLPISQSATYLYNDNENEQPKYYYFTRPPVINICLGRVGGEEGVNSTYNKIGKPVLNKNSVGGVYKNLFTEIVSTYDSDNRRTDHDIYYKNFVVTNVSIDKNQNDYNFYIPDESNGLDGKDYDYLDTTGFTVSLTVMEIDENYLGSMPSFNNYYNTLKARKRI